MSKYSNSSLVHHLFLSVTVDNGIVKDVVQRQHNYMLYKIVTVKHNQKISYVLPNSARRATFTFINVGSKMNDQSKTFDDTVFVCNCLFHWNIFKKVTHLHINVLRLMLIDSIKRLHYLGLLVSQVCQAVTLVSFTVAVIIGVAIVTAALMSVDSHTPMAVLC